MNTLGYRFLEVLEKKHFDYQVSSNSIDSRKHLYHSKKVHVHEHFPTIDFCSKHHKNGLIKKSLYKKLPN